MIRAYGGKELAKVLIYYGIISDVVTSDFNINCPFHNDPKPSMRINLSEGTYFCFGCGLFGNAYDFVRNANPELNELQCCVLLEKILNSNEIKKLNIQYQKKHKKQRKQALIEAHDYYYGLRTVDWNKVETKEQQDVLDYMMQRGFDKRALNVSKCKVNCNVAYPIIFPILDNGTFKGWVCRTTNKYVEKNRKYLYNDGFRKRDTLCGTYSEGSIPYICEGYMDYLSLKTRGHLKNVCALLGWHMSDEQMEKLKQKGITTVVSALDNDKSGIKGTALLEKYFHVVRFPYPEGIKDTGEMSEKQIEVAKRKVERRLKREIKV